MKTANLSLNLCSSHFRHFLINIVAYWVTNRHMNINTSLDWGHYGTLILNYCCIRKKLQKNLLEASVHSREKGVKRENKWWILFSSLIWPDSYFHASYALPVVFEFFDNLDCILNSFWPFLTPLKWVYWANWKSCEHLINRAQLRNKNRVCSAVVFHLWRLKNVKFPIFII